MNHSNRSARTLHVMTSKDRKEARYLRRKNKRQMKRGQYAHYDDYEWVFSYEHLYISYKRCRQNVTWKASTQCFITFAPTRIYRLYQTLMKNQYKSKGFFEFDIVERGKKRHIRSVRIDERVVQRCLCDFCLVPLLSRTFIHDNGASLKNKGYHFARKRAIRALKRFVAANGTEGYALVFDFSKYFDNISHELCKEILHENVSDDRIIRLVEHFIDMFGEKGLGLGSQISQIFALATANRLDHYIKEKLNIRDYVRYMDDGVLIHESKAYLRHCLEKIKTICKRDGIVLNCRKTMIVKLSHGFTWIKTKFNVLPSGRILRRLTRGTIVIMRRKMKKLKRFLDDGRMKIFDVYMSFQSWRSYAMRFDAHRTITKLETLFYNIYGVTFKASSLIHV